MLYWGGGEGEEHKGRFQLEGWILLQSSHIIFFHTENAVVEIHVIYTCISVLLWTEKLKT
jgi:hypothetical protein